MPEQAALSELKLSPTFKCCQRALAQWLEQRPGGSISVMVARHTLTALSGGEWSRLVAWLELLQSAAQENGDMALSARIERLVASLGHRIPLKPADHPAAATLSLIGTAVPRSA